MENNIIKFCKKFGITENQFSGIIKIDGYLDLSSKSIEINKKNNSIKTWQGGKYISADGMFVEVVTKKCNIYTVKKLHTLKEFYLITDGKDIHAHGKTIEEAKEDFRFKVLSEKIKNDPIYEDTIIDTNFYRTITGACQFGVNEFKKKHNLGETIKAKDLIVILEKSNAYGVSKFKSLCKF